MSGIVGTSHSKSKIIGRSKDTAIAWCRFNGQGTNTYVDIDDFNISSYADSGGGETTITFMKAMPSANYAACGYGYNFTGSNVSSVFSSTSGAMAANVFKIRHTWNFSTTLIDGYAHSVIFFGPE